MLLDTTPRHLTPLFRILLEVEESDGQGHLAARVVNVQGYKFTTLLPPSRHHRRSEIRGEWGEDGKIYTRSS